MPIQETPHAMLLDALHLYRWDVAQHSPRLPKLQQREREHTLVEQARNGDMQARHDLILTLQYVVFSLATSLSHRRKRPDPDLWADLVQEANAQMLEVLGKAIWADNPCSYLVGVARLSMLRWLYGKSDFIRRHDKQPRVEVLSLDAPLNEEGLTLADVLAVSGSSASRADTETRSRAVREAIHSLKQKQQEVILRHYGFLGPAESLNAISSTIARPATHKTDVAYRRHKEALRTMRQQLEGVHV